MFMTTSTGFASNYPPLNARLGPALRDVKEGFRINLARPPALCRNGAASRGQRMTKKFVRYFVK